jgi:hypothetical protein
MLGVFAFTLFCSAMLLFLVEPMAGKMMLPLLGGTPAVWNTCMVFFQAILLAGYAYAHWATTALGSRKQARLQLGILLLPFVSVAVNGLLFSGLLSPNEKLILGHEGNPIPALLFVLTLCIGLPMFVVCTSAPLLQRWFASTDHPAATDPYFLYGASNLGSMLALVGYPVVVEPYLTLRSQQIVWVIGYGVLALLTATCAILMWKSKPAPEPAPAPPTDNPGHSAKAFTPAGTPPSSAIKAVSRDITRGRAPGVPKSLEEIPLDGPQTSRPVTWMRRLHWVALAMVPSSLMLGATTYITTDIAAIPLLWVLPLALYLLTFIIVFAHISPRTQSIVTAVFLILLSGGLAIWIANHFFPAPDTGKDPNETMRWLVYLIGAGLALFALKVLRVRDSALIHRVMIMIMPLLVLLIIFMMLSEIRPLSILANIGLHLAVLFAVSMVCHGELARDRPASSHLTEYFLWMSFGGVVGGLFNGLFAPIAFNGIVEYQLIMMVACLLLPPLGLVKDSIWARRADIGLATVFVGVGAFLLIMCSLDKAQRPDLTPLVKGPWQWGVVALLLGCGLGGLAAWKGWGAPPMEEGEKTQDHWLDRLLDLGLPLALMVLVVGLFWGLPASGIRGRLAGFASMVNMDAREFRNILTFGLPAVLCYTFVERSVRFGLGVGALLLAAAYCTIINDSPLYQDRSFFGVLRVEEAQPFESGSARLWEVVSPGGKSTFFTDMEKLNRHIGSEGGEIVGYWSYGQRRLTHGTTLHGKQLLEAGLRDLPISYYHRTGPIGHVLRAYNTDPNRAIAVIGLGTGSMACYAMKGQTIDFFDIDPVVVGLSYDTDEYFTFVEDAEARGADVNLVLGDARLTVEPKGDKVRLKPLHKRKDKKTPQRQYGEPLMPSHKYGLIVVDAFSSDAIPVHLITRQALEIYRDRLLPDGILCMHISNRYLTLQPVLANIVENLGMAGYHMSDNDSGSVGKNSAHWVAIARKKEHLEKLLHPVRWKTDPDRALLLAPALFPAQATTGLATAGSLSFAFYRVVADHQAQQDSKSPRRVTRRDWMHLSTQDRLAIRLQRANAAVDKLEKDLETAQEKKDKDRIDEARKDLEIARKKVETLRKTIVAFQAVGVWTDDYSNILSVFLKDEDYDMED